VPGGPFHGNRTWDDHGGGLAGAFSAITVRPKGCPLLPR
jgi:hypothetical protein